MACFTRPRNKQAEESSFVTAPLKFIEPQLASSADEPPEGEHCGKSFSAIIQSGITFHPGASLESRRFGTVRLERPQRDDVVSRESAPFSGSCLPAVTRWSTCQPLAPMVNFDQRAVTLFAATPDGMGCLRSEPRSKCQSRHRRAQYRPKSRCPETD